MSKSTEDKILAILEQIRDSIRIENDHPLSIDEAAAFLRLSKSTLYIMTSRRRIPFAKSNGRLWFTKSDLSKYVLSNRRAPVDEIVDKLRESRA